MADKGRAFIINKAASPIAGCQSDSMSVNNAPVDITDKASNGWRELAGFAGTRSIDLAISGVWKDKTVRDLALGADSALLLSDVTLDFADGGSFSAGDWYLSSYEETGDYAGAVTFTGTLLSSGEITYTPAV